MDMDDARAFVNLYQEEYPRVVSYARRRLGNLADAEDTAAEVFRLAWEKSAPVSVGWLYVTAKNIVWSRQRSEVRSSQLLARIASETSEASDPTTEDHDLLQALGTLSDDDRELLMARYWDDLSGAQCAQLMGCSTATVFVRLSRARKVLKRVLEEGTLAVAPVDLGSVTPPEQGSVPTHPIPEHELIAIPKPHRLDFIQT